MRAEKSVRIAHLVPTGKPVACQRDAQTKAEEILIEEILKAAGLEPLG